MAAVTVTTVPGSVRVALGLDDHQRGVVWQGTAQNVDTEQAVYRTRSVAAPDVTDPAFRHATGDRWTMAVFGDDLGAAWLWTSEGEATVVLESGLQGV